MLKITSRWILAAATCASLLLGVASLADTPFLRAQDAYRYQVAATDSAVLVTYKVEDGYYLYRKRLDVTTQSEGISLDAVEFPPGLPHSDDYFGEQEIYRGAFTLRVPYHRTSPSAHHLTLQLKLQGCADAGLCYPPQRWSAEVELPATARPPATQAASPAKSAARDGLLGKLVPAAQAPADPQAKDFLPAEKAFQASASVDGPAITAHVLIADGYYLYRNRFHFKVSDGTQLGEPVWPPGETHHDEYFGDQAVFRGSVDIRIPYTGPTPTELTLGYQGCADAGLCYTPQTRTLKFGSATATAAADAAGAGTASAGAEQDRLARLVRSGQWWMVFGAFWFFGLLLAFTPCVLPMVPILAGIIAGDGPRTSSGRAFALSVAYVGGMATTYTVVGVAFAAAGSQAQAVFQQPWILALFAALFVALALAMFGFYELALPSSLQSRFAEASGRIRGGKLLSTAVMGALSSLIVTACVAPPLVATFVVIGQAGAIGRGALALGSLSLGMGTPLLLVGASAGRLLPKSGPWMETVKALFGVVFLGVAVWMLDRLAPARVTQAGWAVVALSAAAVLHRIGLRGGRRSSARTLIAAMAALYGALLLVSAVAGGSDPLRPLQDTPWGPQRQQGLVFQAIHSEAELDAALAHAKASGQRAMLDFSADWCVSCKEMDAKTFSNPIVRARLAHYVVMRADVTANNADDQALLRRFGIFGPPTTAFFHSDGTERRTFRLVGFVETDHFLEHLDRFEATP